MQLTSDAFQADGVIPKRHTGEGEDISPLLRWSNIPDGTKRFALICEDPDAPKRPGMEHPFVHWLVYNISNATSYLPEGLPRTVHIQAPIIADQGVNSWDRIGYGGPMPPRGHGPHRYIFTLYALDAEVGVPGGSFATKRAVLDAIQGHILSEATLIGRYERKAEGKTA
jgi:Raf kinase inhibitor-like YbhB/YbcL family protein